VNGRGSPVWLAGVVKEICEELDPVQGDVSLGCSDEVGCL